MMLLQTNLHKPDRLMFSPDGQALLATAGNYLQLWPRWLDSPPRRPKKVQATLERCALGPHATRAYLYVSGNSHTRVLDFKSGVEKPTELPSGGPSWFHFDTASGLFLVSHDRGKLSRYDLAPRTKSGVREVWTIERPAAGKSRSGPTTLGSHYRFGAICAASGVFVALEYRYGRGEPFDGLVVRSVTDGSQVYRKAMSAKEGGALKDNAGLTLAIHPAGQYFAYPHESRVRFQPLARGAKAPVDLTPAAGAMCRAVSFHPTGALLAVVGDSGTVTLYDTATWKVARAFAWGIGELRAVCFSPDGTRAATIGVGTAPQKGKLAIGRAVVWDVDV